MWLCLNDAFISIVQKDCERDEVMVRARRPGDIEKLFPELQGKVQEYTASDYHYRAAIKRARVAKMLTEELMRVVYSNFKDSVHDRPLHDAYMRVWSAMATLQPKAPYAGRRGLFSQHDFETSKPVGFATVAKAKRRPKSGK